MGDDEDEEDEDSETDADEQNAEAGCEDFAALLPEGENGDLASPEEEIDGDALLGGAVQEYRDVDGETQGADVVAKADDQESDDEGSGGETSEASDGPGQVAVPAARKTRKRQSAKEARKNLQRQQKQKPAKANNQKVREMRNARHQVKEYLG